MIDGERGWGTCLEVKEGGEGGEERTEKIECPVEVDNAVVRGGLS